MCQLSIYCLSDPNPSFFDCFGILEQDPVNISPLPAIFINKGHWGTLPENVASLPGSGGLCFPPTVWLPLTWGRPNRIHSPVSLSSTPAGSLLRKSPCPPGPQRTSLLPYRLSHSHTLQQDWNLGFGWWVPSSKVLVSSFNILSLNAGGGNYFLFFLFLCSLESSFTSFS